MWARIVFYELVACRRVTSRLFACRRVSSRVVSGRLVSSRVVSCRVVSCRFVSCRFVSSHVVSCRAVSCSVCVCVCVGVCGGLFVRVVDYVWECFRSWRVGFGACRGVWWRAVVGGFGVVCGVSFVDMWSVCMTRHSM